jgi:hypothetical protein
MKNASALELAARVREACLREALAAWEDAGMSGLCAEGRWERAMDALRSADLERVVAAVASESAGGDTA